MSSPRVVDPLGLCVLSLFVLFLGGQGCSQIKQKEEARSVAEPAAEKEQNRRDTVGGDLERLERVQPSDEPGLEPDEPSESAELSLEPLEVDKERGPRPYFEMVVLHERPLLLWLEEGRLLAQLNFGSDADEIQLTKHQWLGFDAAELPDGSLSIVGMIENNALIYIHFESLGGEIDIVQVGQYQSSGDWVELLASRSADPRRAMFVLLHSEDSSKETLVFPLSKEGRVGPNRYLSMPSERGASYSISCSGSALVLGFYDDESRKLTFLGLGAYSAFSMGAYWLKPDLEDKPLTERMEPPMAGAFFCEGERAAGWWLGEHELRFFFDLKRSEKQLEVGTVNDLDLVALEQGYRVYLLGSHGLERLDLEDPEVYEESSIEAERTMIDEDVKGHAIDCTKIQNTYCAIFDDGISRPKVVVIGHDPMTTIEAEDVFGTSPGELSLSSESFSLCGVPQWERLYESLLEGCSPSARGDEEPRCDPELFELAKGEFEQCELDPRVYSLKTKRSFKMRLIGDVQLRFKAHKGKWDLVEIEALEPIQDSFGQPLKEQCFKELKPITAAISEYCKVHPDLHECLLIERAYKECRDFAVLRLVDELSPDYEIEAAEEVVGPYLVEWRYKGEISLPTLERIRRREMVDFEFSYYDDDQICGIGVYVSVYYERGKWRVDMMGVMTVICDA